MGLKKIITYILIGFIVSGLFFGVMFYFMNNRQPREVAVTYKTYEYNAGEFSTNLGSTRSYFKGSIIIETTDKNLSTKFEEKNAELRDSIISTLMGKKADEILDTNGQLELKNEILKAVSNIVNSDKITNIYFTDYIIQ